jgi:hypothetical protein
MELQRLITADGLVYPLNWNTKARYMLNSIPSNLGLPPLSFAEMRPYQADYSVELGYYLEPRFFSLSVNGEGCSRGDLWQLRHNLLEAVRPNRSGQLIYIFQQDNGSQYAIKGRVTQLGFPATATDEWYEYGYQDDALCKAIEPWFYEYSASSAIAIPTSFPQLVFPITFGNDGAGNIGIVFGSGSEWGAITIPYAGSWYAYPRITITGPAENIILTHRELRYRIGWLGTLTTGQSLIIDLRPTYDSLGNFTGVTVIDNTGANRFTLLDPLSNLLRFRIEPEGVVSNGVNIFDFQATNTDFITTSVTFEYNTAFIGI